MTMVILPNHVRDAIYKAVDAEIVKVPGAAPGRETYYNQLLNHFYEHGVIPEFSLVPLEKLV